MCSLPCLQLMTLTCTLYKVSINLCFPQTCIALTMETQSITCLLIYTFIFLNTRWCSCNGNSVNNSILRCKPYERAALLNFKHNISYFDKDVSSSWKGEECCNWRRVVCDNTTGHILKLHLNGDDYNNLLRMEKLESMVYLLELRELESLDLSNNDFNYSSIPILMGSMKQLRYLNLSFASLDGLVPYELGNLTNLEFLDLNSNMLSGEIPASLGKLINLKKLDLSYNKLSGKIPTSISKLSKMNELDLSYNKLSGKIPTSLICPSCKIFVHSNLIPMGINLIPTSLLGHEKPIRHGFEFNYHCFFIPMGNVVITSLLIFTFIFFNTRWCICNGNSPNSNSTLRCKPSERAALLSFKHNLTYFDKDISSSWEGEECCQWKRVICDNTTGHVTELDLYGNDSNHLLKMEKLESTVYLLELRQLESLDLSNNDFSYSSIPIFMGSMKQLRYLNLASSSIGGLVPYELGNLTNLLVLYLYENNLSGAIPASLGKLSNLKSLDISDNNLSGEILTVIRKLHKLQFLDITSNSLNGRVLSEPHFANLSSLKVLYMANTMLTLSLSSDWVPPFQLRSFSASNINGQLPPWLQTQKNLSQLFLPNANISGPMPSWFHTMQQLDFVHLSNNNLSGSPIFPIRCHFMLLSNNSLSGEFLSDGSKTGVYREAGYLDLSDNLFSGPILEGLTHIMPNLIALFLYNNQINGQIPNSFCQLTSLNFLDIHNNSLSGNIPNCFANSTSLTFVFLSYNKLKGHIPCFNNRDSYRFGLDVEFHLHLNDNMLSGEVPSCLNDLPNLKVLDIGGNQLSGKMVKWFSADKFRELQIFRLRGNKFSGTIPKQICSLPHLQIMDFAHNHFMGYIPRCLSNLTSMTSPNASQVTNAYDVSEVIQGIEYAYTSTLRYLVDIDLSSNNLVGSIPDDMTKISGLLNLNLSYNQLSGTIPVNIGGLKSLESLDLSNNKLRGSIPTSIGELYMLSHLNLSYNNLSGPIPTGNQLQTLSDQASIYVGNPYLCGDFLPMKCKSKVDKKDKGSSNKGKGNKKEKLEKMGFGLVVMSGFATGFWGVVGGLVVNRRWRHAVFRRVEDGYNWLYVIVAVRVAKARRIIRR
ncbi:receptor-like protein EIX2 [Silene latifolia]|uniref:receptor-like protein EIX2 n=1 Tax=Silene latifolia TaxID=37657 RepID=UPI003D77168A